MHKPAKTGTNRQNGYKTNMTDFNNEAGWGGLFASISVQVHVLLRGILHDKGC
jgi:hypothetical protein